MHSSLGEIHPCMQPDLLRATCHQGCGMLARADIMGCELLPNDMQNQSIFLICLAVKYGSKYISVVVRLRTVCRVETRARAWGARAGPSICIVALNFSLSTYCTCS